MFFCDKFNSDILKNMLLYKTPETDSFMFILVNHVDIIPQYSIIVCNNNMFFNISELNLSQKNIYTMEIKKKIEKYDIQDFLI